MSDDERKEAEALMKRLQAEFGDVDLDLELLGLGEGAASEDEEPTPPAAAEIGRGDDFADAEGAALMARLGAQFGDLDMSQLGLGATPATAPGGEGGGASSTNHNYACEAESDEESSLEDPTPEELAAWQESQFSKGQEKELRKQKEGCEDGIIDSIQERRKLLREARFKQLTEEQAKLRLGIKAPTESAASGSFLDLLGGDKSAFFGPSTQGYLEDLVSQQADGDAEILQTQWKRLYASYEQGLGFWNLWKALRGYDGPTLLVLRCLPSASKALVSRASAAEQQPTACLGFYTTTPWKESPDLYGGDTEAKDGDRAFLFSIDETHHTTGNGSSSNNDNRVRFFPVEQPPGEAAPNRQRGYMYCQPSATTEDATRVVSAVTGLGVGGRPTQPRLHLTESFEDCSCLTYDSNRATRDGDLFAASLGIHRTETASNGSGVDEGHSFARALYCFDVAEIEAWGMGGSEWIDHALSERQRDRQQHIRRFQTVDKQMMWDQGAFGSRKRNR
jgi:hypothetical protein